MLATPDDPAWQRRLRDQVEELDTLEREFAPITTATSASGVRRRVTS